MRYREVVQKLTKLGCEFDRQAKGSYEVWRSRHTGQRATIPNHGSKDLAPGMVRAIVRNLGIDKKDFDNA